MFAIKSLPKNVAFCAEWLSFFNLPFVNIGGGFGKLGKNSPFHLINELTMGQFAGKVLVLFSLLITWFVMVGITHKIPKNPRSNPGWAWMGMIGVCAIMGILEPTIYSSGWFFYASHMYLIL